MSEEITISVTQLHADLHEQLSENVDDYDEMVRNNVENLIHNIHQKAERAREQQSIMNAEIEETVENGDN